MNELHILLRSFVLSADDYYNSWLFFPPSAPIELILSHQHPCVAVPFLSTSIGSCPSFTL